MEKMHKRKKGASMSDHDVYQIITFALSSLVSVRWRSYQYCLHLCE